MNKKSALYMIMINLICLSSVFSQSSISGKISDDELGEGLIGCNVYLKNTGYGTASDLEGNYILRNISSGQFILVVSYIGYETEEVQIDLTEDQALHLDFNMKYSGSYEIDQVVVTAQAKGQMAAINQQIASKEIKNIVSKERIQELPDANAAEAVGRLPGVSLQREGGEGNKVIIRGMSPKYNKVLIGGVELASTGLGDRSTNIGMISPYSLEGIEVTKAITPDKDADFIGGTVNFKLQNADSGFHANVVAQGSYNQLHESFANYNLNISLSNRFFKNKLGLFVQMNAENRNRGSNNMNAGYYLKTSTDEWDNVSTGSVALQNVIRAKKRNGGTLILDYSIPNGVISLNNILNIGNTLSTYYNESYGVVDRAFNASTYENENKLSLYSNILNYEQDFSDFKIDASLSHSYSENNTPYDVAFSFSQPGVLTQVPNNNNLDPKLVPEYAFDPLTGASNIDYSKSYFQRVDDNTYISKDRRIQASVNMEWFFNISSQINGSIKAGGKYRTINRSYDKETTGGLMNLASGTDLKQILVESLGIEYNGESYIPFTYFADNSFEHHEFLNGDYTLGSIVDPTIMRNSIELMRSSVEPGSVDMTYGPTPFQSRTYDYSGNETVYAGYIMAYLNLTSKLELIPGFRYESNNTTYTGVRGYSSALENANYTGQDTTTSRSNGFLLPMVHLRFKPVTWFTAHLAYTNSLARPDFNILIPRQDIGVNTISHNCFDILPERSENFDLYLSFHQKKVGLFTIGGFVKNISDKIYQTDQRLNLYPEQYGLPANTNNKLIVTQENLEEPVSIKGFELDWQSNFWYLPGLLKGLVANVNYTHITSEAKYPKTTVSTYYDDDFNMIQENNDTLYTNRMIDQPDHILNISLGYDIKNFSVRVSMFYQSNIFAGNNFNPELIQITDDYLRWDLSMNYKFDWAVNTKVFLNITNINQAKDVILMAGATYPSSIHSYGRVIDLGIRLDF